MTMSQHANNAHHAPAALGGKLMSPVTAICGVLVVLMVLTLAVRFVYGLGAVTNLSDGFPWGIWVVYDVVIGSAFACGGFSVAMLVYVLNKGEYHPMVRPALVASLFGYTLAGVGVLFDLGRYWNFWHIFWPGYSNPDSVMFEVATCISLYIVVMWIEFAPAAFEKWGLLEQAKKLEKWMFLVLALGTVLPMMHQSSLGTLLVVFGEQIYPLWQTQLLPVIFLVTAVMLGYAVVIFEASLVSVGFKREGEMPLLRKLSKVMVGILVAYLVVRFADIIVRGALGKAFEANLEAFMFWVETLLFAAPLLLIGREADRNKPQRLFLSAVALMLAGFLLRINAFLVGYETGPGWTYFPSVPELLVTFGIIALEVLGYIAFVRYFPVLPRDAKPAAAAVR
jgi:Ni/Fe-hydrogenase subunit HybB-like protein